MAIREERGANFNKEVAPMAGKAIWSTTLLHIRDSGVKGATMPKITKIPPLDDFCINLRSGRLKTHSLTRYWNTLYLMIYKIKFLFSIGPLMFFIVSFLNISHLLRYLPIY
jgi:hypothetical protein